MREKDVQTQIPFRIHPRVFAALGADLVTNDVVAVIELVKNAYDAFASRVDVMFGVAEDGHYLDILDNGDGMDRPTLENAWCVVATPYRKEHPINAKGRKTRRVSGEKGLGRLSTARLGKQLDMVTKAAGGPCWQVLVDWSALSIEDTLDACYATCRRFSGPLPFGSTGTRVRISSLNADWDDQQVGDLRENLARLISPFSKIDDFSIHLTAPNLDDNNASLEIVAPEFLNKPPYAIRGHVTPEGTIHARYEYSPLSNSKPRQSTITRKWSEIVEGSDVSKKLKGKYSGCGPFEFEIRAWDLGQDDTQEIAERFDIAKGHVRKAIRSHKGISVYRDGILVLPKSEDARDWLGLDLRRVSRVGSRLSTSQIVGYVSITAAHNADLEDTSDREGLAANSAVLAFQEILKAIVSALEVERDTDRLKPGEELRLEALLDGVSADDLLEEVTALAEDGGITKEAVQRIQAFNAGLHVVRDALKRRFTYYSRLATVGTIAQMLVHEIRNRTTAIARFLRTSDKRCLSIAGPEFESQLRHAESAVQALEQLADTFMPLASRGFRRGRRDSVLEESITRCLSLVEGDRKKLDIRVTSPRTGETRVGIDPGELDTVILNLILNAVYWIGKSERKPELELVLRRTSDLKRVRLSISDSGPGVPEDDAEKIFLPGVTRKAGGIGMGLTVAAEIVSDHGGKISLVQPGRLGGATLILDFPLKT